MKAKPPAPRSLRKALVELAAAMGSTVTTLVLTAGPAEAAIGYNHNENATLDR